MEVFVVRLWRPASVAAQSGPADDGADPDILRGVIEQPVTGNSRPFESSAELVEIMTVWRDAAGIEPSDRQDDHGVRRAERDPV